MEKNKSHFLILFNVTKRHNNTEEYTIRSEVEFESRLEGNYNDFGILHWRHIFSFVVYNYKKQLVTYTFSHRIAWRLDSRACY